MSDFFTLLGLEKGFFQPDEVLRKSYINAQQACHPDRCVHASQAEKMQALQRSADVNAAYHCLKKPLTRAEYLLSLEGVLVGSEEGAVKASPALLMESMELRETLMEAEDADSLAACEAQAQALTQECMGDFVQHYDDEDFTQAAQTAIRWRFCEKFLEEVARARRKRKE